MRKGCFSVIAYVVYTYSHLKITSLLPSLNLACKQWSVSELEKITSMVLELIEEFFRFCFNFDIWYVVVRTSTCLYHRFSPPFLDGAVATAQRTESWTQRRWPRAWTTSLGPPTPPRKSDTSTSAAGWHSPQNSWPTSPKSSVAPTLQWVKEHKEPRLKRKRCVVKHEWVTQAIYEMDHLIGETKDPFKEKGEWCFLLADRVITDFLLTDKR